MTVPTTKILATGRWTSKATTAGVSHLLPTEVRDTVRLYLDGFIDQWFIQQDNSGVVFLLNVTDTDKAYGLLEKLPLGQAGLMEFQLTPLGPISALGSLIKARQLGQIGNWRRELTIGPTASDYSVGA